MKTSDSGFSLIEITIAIVLMSTILLGFVGVMAMGVKAANDSTRRTTLGALIGDVHHRMEGAPLKEGSVKGSPYFYDREGRFISSKAPSDPERLKIYRVDVRLVRPHQSLVADRYGNAVPVRDHAPGLYAAKIEIRWPLSQEGKIDEHTHNSDSMTYFVNTLTGPNWERIDRGFEPVIEF